MNVHFPKAALAALLFLWAQQLARAQQPDEVVNGEISAGIQTVRATQTISSTQKIFSNGTEVVYRAGSRITLNPGFTVYGGAKFSAIIGNPNGREGHTVPSNEPESRGNFVIYPNPFIDKIIVEFSAPNNVPESIVHVDLVGR